MKLNLVGGRTVCTPATVNKTSIANDSMNINTNTSVISSLSKEKGIIIFTGF